MLTAVKNSLGVLDEDLSNVPTYCVYLLALDCGYYYVGISKYLKLRLAQHWEGAGALVTQKWRPKRLVRFWQVYDPWHEHELFKTCVEKFGIDRVFGGFCCSTDVQRNKANFLKYYST